MKKIDKKCKFMINGICIFHISTWDYYIPRIGQARDIKGGGIIDVATYPISYLVEDKIYDK